ncbi:MAG: hypothetical protein IPH74_15040 [Bacteroidetes bacterium]|nr:hypothetical protein [Bacteroidota bacterium]
MNRFVNISDDCGRLVVCGQPDVTIPVYLEKAPEVVNVVDGPPDVPVNLTIELKSIYYDLTKTLSERKVSHNCRRCCSSC